MEPTLDEVRLELAGIHDQLLTLPADDFVARVDLRERQNELRALSANLVAEREVHDAAALKAAYVRLQEVRDTLVGSRVRTPLVGRAAAMDGFTVAMNQAIDAGVTRGEIEALLKEILERLQSSD